MPSSSAAQHRAMEAAAHGHSTLGIPKKVGEEFVSQDEKPRTLYVRRPLLNTREFLAWAILQGFDETLKAEDLHVTIAFSKKPVDWASFKPRVTNATVLGGFRFVEALGNEGAVCLIFQSDELAERHRTFEDGGASWDWPQYRPHVTITYKGAAVDLAQVAPFDGPLEFGPEVFEEVDEGWANKIKGAQDSLALDKASVRSYDKKSGHLRVETTPISKAVVNPYRGNEIPNWQALGLSADRVYQLYRDPEELAAGASTFIGKPILLIHKPSTADEHPREVTVGSIGDDIEFKAPYLMAPLNIWDGEAIELIESGEQRELSCGYNYVPVMASGSTPEGEYYDGRMTKIEGNHLALVSSGRAGADVMVGDSALIVPPKNEEMTMAKTVNPRKAALAKGIKLAADAKLDELKTVLMAIDELEPDEKDDKSAKDGEKGDLPRPGGDKRAKDKKAMDRKARDEAIKEKLKDRMSAEDWKAACDDIDGMEAEDEEEETEEEAKAREAKEAKDRKSARDEEKDMVTKSAMDSAIKTAVVDAETATMKRLQDIRAAERAVAPLIGEVGMGLDSAEAIYRAAFKHAGVDVKNVDPSAFPAMVEMLNKQSAAPNRTASRMANDAAPASDRAEFEKAHGITPRRIRVLG